MGRDGLRLGCHAAPAGLTAHRARGEGGFALLEALAAFLIASIALAALLRGGLDALGQAGAASRLEGAVAVARSELAAFDTATDSRAREIGGAAEGGYRWLVRVAPVDPDLYDLSVVVTWREGRREGRVRLDTQRLVQSSDAPP